MKFLRPDGRDPSCRRSGRRRARWSHLYGERILPNPHSPVRRRRRRTGWPTSSRAGDLIVAATAQRHGLTILSRNLKHFAPLRVPVLNPFAALPPAPPA